MNALDMSAFIAPKSDQINADDLIGGPRTITITGVSANEGSPEQPINIRFDGDDGKPFRPCKSMRRVMVNIWGPKASDYVGRSMRLYRDPKVQFGGMQVGGIRISHMSHIDEAKTMALTASKAKRAPFKVEPLRMDAPAPKADKAAEVADGIIARIQAGEDVTVDDKVQEQRAWLVDKRPELAAKVDAAMASASFSSGAADDSADIPE